MYGELLSGLGSLVGYGAASKENRSKTRSLGRYQNAFEQYSDYGDQENNDLVNALSGLSHDRYANYAEVGAKLNGPGATQAGDAGQSDYLARLNQAMAATRPQMAQNGRRGLSQRAAGWQARAAGLRQPRLDANAAMIAQSGRVQGRQGYEQGLYDQAAEGDVSLGRKTAEQSRRAGLLEAFRNRKLQSEGVRFNHNGPSNGVYNAQMVSELMKLGGNTSMAMGA